MSRIYFGDEQEAENEEQKLTVGSTDEELAAAGTVAIMTVTVTKAATEYLHYHHISLFPP